MADKLDYTQGLTRKLLLALVHKNLELKFSNKSSHVGKLISGKSLEDPWRFVFRNSRNVILEADGIWPSDTPLNESRKSSALGIYLHLNGTYELIGGTNVNMVVYRPGQETHKQTYAELDKILTAV